MPDICLIVVFLFADASEMKYVHCKCDDLCCSDGGNGCYVYVFLNILIVCKGRHIKYFL